MSVVEGKKLLRKQIKGLTQCYSEEELQEMSSSVLAKLELEPAFQNAKIILLYWSLPDEVFTHSFIEKWSKHKTILLPVIVDEAMQLHVYEGVNNMELGPFGILQPSTKVYEGNIDLVLVPGRAFNAKGQRLGRGKGFYDIFLKDYKGIAIGICFDFQVVEIIPVEPFDVPMDKILY